MAGRERAGGDDLENARYGQGAGGRDERQGKKGSFPALRASRNQANFEVPDVANPWKPTACVETLWRRAVVNPPQRTLNY